MPKYTVSIEHTFTQTEEVQVEAEHRDEAERLALDASHYNSCRAYHDDSYVRYISED